MSHLEMFYKKCAQKAPVSEPLFEKKVAGLSYSFIKKETPTKLFPCEFGKIFKSTYIKEQLRAEEIRLQDISVESFNYVFSCTWIFSTFWILTSVKEADFTQAKSLLSVNVWMLQCLKLLQMGTWILQVISLRKTYLIKIISS